MSGNLKKIILIIVALIGAALIWIFQTGIYSTSDLPSNQPEAPQTDQISVTSTNLSPTEETPTLLPIQPLEITFNIPLENIGEFKNKIEPTVKYKLELSSDRKTIKIIPETSWKLGSSYLLTILPNSKFNIDSTNSSSKKILDHDISLRFKTIEYRGI